MKKRSKIDVLKLIRDHEGEMTWYPISTFFPQGSFAEGAAVSGTEVVKEFVDSGLVDVLKEPSEFGRYQITEAGLQLLNEAEKGKTNRRE